MSARSSGLMLGGTVVLLLATPISAQFPLLADVNQQPVRSVDSWPHDFLELNGRVLAVANSGLFSLDPSGAGAVSLSTSIKDYEHYPSLIKVGSDVFFMCSVWSGVGAISNTEIWHTDGTSSGTVPVLTSPVGDWGIAWYGAFAAVGTKLFFDCTIAGSGHEFVVYDTTTGQSTPFDINPGSSSSRPEQFVACGDKMYFVADDGVHGRELWVSNGTPAGTHLVKDLSAGSATFHVLREKVPGGGNPSYLVISATIVSFGSWLWRTDGSAAGTTVISECRAIDIMDLPGTSNFLISGEEMNSGLGRELYWSDGHWSSLLGITLVRDLNVGSPSSNVEFFGRIGSDVLFRADDGTHGYELWITDGTAAGTSLVKDIQPGSSSGSPWAEPGNAAFTVGGSAGVAFAAGDGTSGRELWFTDGTATGTRRLVDVVPGAASAGVGHVTVAGSDLLFSADHELLGQEPWISDGTPAGTLMLADLNTAAIGNETRDGDPTDVIRIGRRTLYPRIEANGEFLFIADDGIHGREFWMTDGSRFVLVSDLRPGPEGCDARDLELMETFVYFSARDGGNVRRLFRHNARMSWLNTPPPYQVSAIVEDPSHLVALGGRLVFRGTDPSHGYELWLSDGTAATTRLVRDIEVGTASSNPESFISFDNRIFFVATTSTAGMELWRTDGTASGTDLFVDLRPGTLSSAPTDLVVFGDRLYFAATTAQYGRELWSTDGTVSGTVLVKDIQPGSAHGSPLDITCVRDRLFFIANDGVHGAELWSSDGTSAGTQLVLDVRPGPTSGGGVELTALDDLLFYAPTDANGREPWRSDGTAAGTFRLRDVEPGSGSSFPRHPFTSGSRHLWFSAYTAASGRELYRTDGTTAGTVAMAEWVPGAGSSAPEPVAAGDGQIVFVATDARYGRELRVQRQRATTIEIGVGCSQDALVPTLSVDDLVPGAPFAIRIGRLRPGGAALIALGVSSLQSIVLAPDCRVFLHPAAVDLLGPFTVVSGTATWNAFMPNVTELIGLEVGMHGLGLPSTLPSGFDLSPGVFATIGY